VLAVLGLSLQVAKGEIVALARAERGL